MKLLTVVSLLAVVLVSQMVGNGQVMAQSPGGASGTIPGRYIVVFKANVDAMAETRKLEQSLQIKATHVYTRAVRGFAGALPDAAVTALRRNPNVAFVEADQIMRFQPQSVPTGILRAQADENATASIDNINNPLNIDVAVIDSGSGPHPELNIAGGMAQYGNCTGTALEIALCRAGLVAPTCGFTDTFNDGHGHGTHVAGTIGAVDDNVGVVGMAPGARIWSVRVIGSDGIGCNADVIAGVDWVTANASIIEVANMSLGGGDSPALCTAIAASVAAGVTYAVAAGNSGVDAAGSSPANCAAAITVSAIADYNGEPGGGAAATCANHGADDAFATFSNFGSVVDIAAPGVCINSSWLSGGYNTISGTSMATPHVAGAAALLKVQNPGWTPAQVRAGLLGDAFTFGSPCHFSGDPDPSHEPLLNVGPACSDSTPPTVVINQAAGQADPTSATPVNFTVTFSESVTGFAANDVVLGGTANPASAVVSGGPAVYNVAVNGMTGPGTVTASAPAGAASDALGNASLGSTSTDNVVTYDAAAPNNPGNIQGTPSGNTIAMTWSPASDNGPSGVDGYAYVFTTSATPSCDQQQDLEESATGVTSTPLFGGSYYFYICTVDKAGNWNSPASAGPFVIDAPPPPPSQELAADGFECGGASCGTGWSGPWQFVGSAAVTNQTLPYQGAYHLRLQHTGDAVRSVALGGYSTVEVRYCAKVYSFEGNDRAQVRVNGQVLKTFVNGDDDLVYRCYLHTATVSGAIVTLTFDGLMTATTDYVYIDNVSIVGLYDTASPTVVVNQASAQADPTNAGTVNFTVTFSENVTGFAANDVTLGGTANPASAVVSGGPAVYNVGVSGMTGPGTVTASVPAGAASDALGNASLASASTDNVVTYDATAPNNPGNIQGTVSGDTIAMTWTAASDNGPSGVDGYAYVFSTNATPACDQQQDLEESATGVTSASLQGGSYYFYICTVDKAGNWSSAASAGPFVIDVPPPPSQELAIDGFECGGANCGSGWSGAWQLTSNASVTSQTVPYQGAYHLRLQSGADATRSAALGVYSTVEVYYCAKVYSFEGTDQAQVRVNGQVLKTFVVGDDDLIYRCYVHTVTLSGATASLTFDAMMSATTDYIYFDNVRIVGVAPQAPASELAESFAWA